MSDDVLINIRATGGDAAAREVKKPIDAFQDAQGRWRAANGRFLTVTEQTEMGLRRTTAEANRLRFSLNNVNSGLFSTATAATAARRGTYLLGGAVATTGGLAVKSGLQFDAFQEQSQVAFEKFLGSARAARRERDFLFKEAAHSPFELTNVTNADEQLLAFNFTLKQTHGWLKSIGDAASVKGPDAIQRIVTAIGQIKSKGRLQGDELLQLQELGIIDSKRLAHQLGVTPTVLYSGRGQIDEVKALRAIKAQIDDTFGGQSAKQAKTFNGQLSTLHDIVTQDLGKATFPLFEKLRKDVFPALSGAGGDIGHILDRKDLTGGQKFKMSAHVAEDALRPFFLQARREFDQMHVGDWMEHQFELAAPKVMDAAGHLAEKAVTGFVSGWWHAGPYGKMFAVGLIAKKLGVFSLLGEMAADSFTGGWRRRGPGKGPAPKAEEKGINAFLKKAAPWAVGPGSSLLGAEALPFIGAAAAGAGLTVGTAKVLHLGRYGHDDPMTKSELAAQRARALDDAVRRGNATYTPAELRERGARTRYTARPGERYLTPVVLKVGEKTLAQVLARQVEDARARRGR